MVPGSRRPERNSCLQWLGITARGPRTRSTSRHPAAAAGLAVSRRRGADAATRERSPVQHLGGGRATLCWIPAGSAPGTELTLTVSRETRPRHARGSGWGRGVSPGRTPAGDGLHAGVENIWSGSREAVTLFCFGSVRHVGRLFLKVREQVRARERGKKRVSYNETLAKRLQKSHMSAFAARTTVRARARAARVMN